MCFNCSQDGELKKGFTTTPRIPKTRNTANHNTKYWRKQKEDYDLIHNKNKPKYFAFPPYNVGKASAVGKFVVSFPSDVS